MEQIIEELASQVNKKDELWLEAQQDIAFHMDNEKVLNETIFAKD